MGRHKVHFDQNRDWVKLECPLHEDKVILLVHYGTPSALDQCLAPSRRIINVCKTNE